MPLSYFLILAPGGWQVGETPMALSAFLVG